MQKIAQYVLPQGSSRNPEERRIKTVKGKVLLQALLFVLVSVYAAQAATVITDIRRNPFYNPPLTSVEDLRYMMQVARGDIWEGMNQAGYPHLFEPLMAQYHQVQIDRVEYSPGQNFLWMLSKERGYGQVRVVRDMVWGGNHMLSSYEFSIAKDGMNYVFSVPLACGNLALKEVHPISGKGLSGKGKWLGSSGCSGFACLPFRFVADVGYLKQTDPADYLLLRVGFEHYLTERLSLLSMIGGAPKMAGSDGTDAFLVDFLLQYDWFRFMLGNQWSQTFVGIGLGGWITSGDSDNPAEDTDLDVIANIGARIYGDPNAFNASLFLEARSAVDEFDSLADYGRFGFGLRCRF
jgi:hypothetical protein